jgi:glycosyltransferase involved in cell wall biosynthesis
MVFVVTKMDDLPNEITLISVVRNVEETYELCLRQAARVCNEILIVDQSSTDKTKEIIDECFKDFKKDDKKVSYEIKEETGLGESHRQYLIDKASNKWILLLDGDEFWSDKLLEFIKLEFKYQLEYDELKIQRVTLIPGLKPAFEEDMSPRFWRKENSFCPIQLNAELQGTKNSLTRNDLCIAHLCYDKNQLFKKYDKYDEINYKDYQEGKITKEKYLRDKKIVNCARLRAKGKQ